MRPVDMGMGSSLSEVSLFWEGPLREVSPLCTCAIFICFDLFRGAGEMMTRSPVMVRRWAVISYLHLLQILGNIE